MIPWWAASLLANVCIAVVEYLNRTAGYPHFGAAILRTGVPILLAQWCLWRAFATAPSFLSAWAVFTLGGAILRLGNVYLIGEPVSPIAWVGVALVMAGGALVRHGIH